MQESARDAIESLELWLRKIIDSQLTKKYGSDYFNATNEKEQRLIKSSILREVEKRRSNNKRRFPRKIDALLLEEEIAILCNPNIYKSVFEDVFMNDFPLGNESLRNTLNKITPIRNKLSHSNHTSERENERAVCYSHDVIDSIKDYYKKMNQEKEYNVPSINHFKDSKGNKVYASQFCRVIKKTPYFSFRESKDSILFPKDKLTLEIAIDESFNENEYTITWTFYDSSEPLDIKRRTGKKLTINIEERHIRETLQIDCSVVSKKEWHRFRSYDDSLRVFYKVLPLQN